MNVSVNVFSNSACVVCVLRLLVYMRGLRAGKGREGITA